MEFSSFFFHLLFFCQIFQLSNTIVSSAKVQIPAQNGPTDKLDSLTEQIPSFDSFARTFNKSYPTVVDGMAQMRYHLVRDLKTSNSVIRHKKHNSTSHLTNNEMSDLSPAEVKQLYMSHDTHEKVKPAAIELADIDDDNAEDEKDADIGKRLVQQRIKRDTDDDTEEVVYIDHRQSGCLAEELRNQLSCDASYAFATIAFYEWLSCMITGEFKAFSEQYVIDCGHGRGTGGCTGGNPAGAVMFVKNCGLELREDFPYIGRQKDCYYDSSFAYADMGSLRINEPGLTFIPIDQRLLEEHLQYGPIIVTVEIGNGFFSYAGGVDDNVGHTPELLHTMLLIGHGRENGREYWLFRNSHFATFSDVLWHYKLNKNVDCLRGESGIGVSRHILGLKLDAA